MSPLYFHRFVHTANGHFYIRRYRCMIFCPDSRSIHRDIHKLDHSVIDCRLVRMANSCTMLHNSLPHLYRLCNHYGCHKHDRNRHIRHFCIRTQRPNRMGEYNGIQCRWCCYHISIRRFRLYSLCDCHSAISSVCTLLDHT